MPPTTTPPAPGRAGAPADPARRSPAPDSTGTRATAGHRPAARDGRTGVRATRRGPAASVRPGSAAPSGRAGRPTTREAS